MREIKEGDTVVTCLGTGRLGRTSHYGDCFVIFEDGTSKIICGGCDFCAGVQSIEDKHAPECHCKRCGHA